MNEIFNRTIRETLALNADNDDESQMRCCCDDCLEALAKELAAIPITTGIRIFTPGMNATTSPSKPPHEDTKL